MCKTGYLMNVSIGTDGTFTSIDILQLTNHITGIHSVKNSMACVPVGTCTAAETQKSRLDQQLKIDARFPMSVGPM
jgi:hypothetical protein